MVSSRLQSTLAQVLLIAIPLANAAAVPSGHEYQAPGSTDVRSPCPGLNSLANHGFLPRTGKGVTIPELISGLKTGINVGLDFTTVVGLMGLASAPNPATFNFDLDDLDEHNFLLEHDASLSRGDVYFGDNHTFNQTIFNEILAYYKSTDVTTIPLASAARYNRVETARPLNPTFTYGIRQLVLSYGETALYMSVMGEPINGAAPVSYVKEFFEQGRLPYEQGWQPSTTETNLLTLGQLITKLQLANPQAVPEGLTLGEGTLRDVWSLVDPLTGKLINVTCSLLDDC